ncbi:MAG: hypothetical protein ACK5U8_15425 [Deltaproteobacteria bacterium]
MTRTAEDESWVLRRAVRVVAAALFAVAAGCGNRGGPDAHVELPDAPANLDSDGDGLCDLTELSRGTATENPDTDGDGFSDLVELLVVSDALMVDSPDRDQLVVLPTDRLATSSVSLTYAIRAEGGSFVGGFSARPLPLGDGTSANDHFLRATAVTATPLSSVSQIDGERFVGVVGRTLLSYQIDFEYRGDALVECMRVYPFGYQVKLEDGNIVGLQSRILLVAPRGMEPGNGVWCEVSASCL